MTNVSIIGGGIGGLCAALALQQRNIDAVAYERAVEPRDVGAGLIVWPNAMKVLRALGVGEAVVSAGARLTRSQIRAADGKALYETSLDELETSCGAPVIAIHRAALHRILADALKPGALRFAMSCTGFAQDAHSVAIQFEGSRTVRADLLIGADGIHSVVRKQMFPDIRRRYSGYTAWRGVVETADETALGVTSESWGRGARFGIVRIDHRRVYWFATHNQPPGDASSPAERKMRLLKIFGDWHDPIRYLLEATPASAILQNDIYDIPPFAPWTRGRITLLGDAAHPTTPTMGQGACMAIESAYVLARWLHVETDHILALQRYEVERRARTAWVTNTSRRLGAGAQIANPILCSLRNWLVRLLPKSVLQSPFYQAAGFDVVCDTIPEP